MYLTPQDAPANQVAMCVNFHGPFRILSAEQELPTPGKRGRAILAILALRQAPLRREELAELLWHDKPERQSRESLRQELHKLKTYLKSHDQDCVSFGRESISVKDDRLTSDIERIEQSQSDESIELMLGQLTIDMDILPGLDGVSAGLDDWLHGVRAELAARLARSLAATFNDDSLNDTLRQRAAEAALRLDPVDEAACRAAMSIATKRGETGRALRTYNSLFEAMADLLDSEPSQSTVDLVVSIKQGVFPAQDTPSLPAQPKTTLTPATVKAPKNPVPTVAIVPFRILWRHHEELADIGDALVEETVARLTTFKEPLVVSTNSTSRYVDGDFDIATLRARLNVDYVVTGSLRPLGDAIRYNVNLIDTDSQVVLWANSASCVASDINSEIENMAVAIARTIVPTLRTAELRASSGKAPYDMSVYQLVARARELLFRMDKNAMADARNLLLTAADLDEFYAPTHVALSNLYSLRLGQGWALDRGRDAASLEQALTKAVNLDEGNGRALALLGHSRILQNKNPEEARNLADRAVGVTPNDAETLMWSSSAPAFGGDTDKAIDRAEQAMALSPEDPLMFRFEHFLGSAKYLAGNFEEAVEWGMRSADRNDRYTSNLRMTAAAAIGCGRTTLAKQLATKSLEIEPDFSVGASAGKFPVADIEWRKQHSQRLLQSGLPL